jgi:hypothetical protein
MAESIRHALTGFIYTRNDDGSVTVRDPATGRTGHYDHDGNHVSGELDYVDHHLLGHMRGARAVSAGRRGSTPTQQRAGASKEQA